VGEIEAEECARKLTWRLSFIIEHIRREQHCRGTETEMKSLNSSASLLTGVGVGATLLFIVATVLSGHRAVSSTPGELPAASSSESTEVSIRADSSVQHQVIEGFGASFFSEVIGGTDMLTGSQRARALDAVFNQVKITTGQAPTLIEAPSMGNDYYARRKNDNGDPFDLDWNGFNVSPGDTFRQKVVDLLSPEATADIFPEVHMNIRWASPWLKALRPNNNLFLDECAEQVLAGVTYWKNAYGREPRFAMLFNEPTTGNGELDGGSNQEIVDIIKRAGARLRAAGFGTVKFITPAQETESSSLNTARAIVADPEARQYVGALSYHPYPYGSTYSYIPNVLATSGVGQPDAQKTLLRNQLRDTGNEYGIPVWMNEVSHGLDGIQSPDLRSFDVVRGRAIHIHDELSYADAAAFYGMLSMWSAESRRLHDGTSQLTNPDDIVVTYQSSDRVEITGMGYAIGHYARWIRRGAIRIEAASSDPLVLVTAFRDPIQQRTVFVLINNSGGERVLNVALESSSIIGSLTGEQSTAETYWKPLLPFPPAGAASFTLTVPALSVTTVSGSVAGPSGPRISEASVSGKKLFLTGEGFDGGAVVMLNGTDQKTKNDAGNPAGRLIAKKAGKKILPGQPVSLRVRNRDGQLSGDFSFTRLN
jgi:O-glycosyl hydrolase